MEVTMTEFPCPLPTCNVFPYERAVDLAEHLQDHAAATETAATVATLAPAPINGRRTAAPAAPSTGWHSAPAERRTTVAPTDKQLSYLKSLMKRHNVTEDV